MPPRHDKVQARKVNDPSSLSIFVAYLDDLESIKAERPSKRQKIALDDRESIPCEAVLIKQSCATWQCDQVLSASNKYSALRWDNVGKKIQLNIKRTNEYPERFTVTIRERSQRRCRSDTYPLVFERAMQNLAPIPYDVYLALKVAGLSSDDEQGKLWTKVNLEMTKIENATVLSFEVELYWNTTLSLDYVPVKPRSSDDLLKEVIERYMPGDDGLRLKTAQNVSPQDFFSSAHVPDVDDAVAASIVIEGLETELLPFQKRSVSWLLKREGVQWNDQRTLSPIVHQPHSTDLPYSFRLVSDIRGSRAYVSELFRIITRDVSPFRQVDMLKGGIVSEEMGLGKTVEIIALVTLHKRSAENFDKPIPRRAQSLRSIGTTLVITPLSILEQWMTEIRRHAPGLKVMHYQGVAKYKSLGNEELSDKLASQDIVLTTYSVLSKEFHYTLPPPERSLRGERKHTRMVSPLTALYWWRVCLDEAQMVESGVSAVAFVARDIPRVHSWAVTGTPVRTDVDDLLGLLNFLRLEPYSSLRYYWDILVQSHKKEFKQLFGAVALRHSKHDVRGELRLPGQQRFVITTPFTPIEEQYYQSLFREMAQEVGVDQHGAPLTDHWNPDDPSVVENMRTWLVRLRQCALHPEVGGRNRRRLGPKDGPLRTVDEVLDVMLEQSAVSIAAKTRELLMCKLRRGQFYENGPRVQEAYNLWTNVVDEAQLLVLHQREQLDHAIARLHNEITRSGVMKSNPDFDVHDSTEVSDNNEASRIENQATIELQRRVGVHRSRLRDNLQVEHLATYYRTNAIFQLKSNEAVVKPGSDRFKQLEEMADKGYDHAKALRKEMLKEIFSKTNRLIRRVATHANNKTFATISKISAHLSFTDIHAKRVMEKFENKNVLDRFNALVKCLDAQARQYGVWQNELVKLLMSSLVDAEVDADVTGEEYEESLKTQSDIMVLTTILRTVVEDRHDALTGQHNIRVEADIASELKLANVGQGSSPEKLIELCAIREQIKPSRQLGSVRGTLSELRGLIAPAQVSADYGGIRGIRAEHELTVLQPMQQKVQSMFSQQSKVVEELRKEVVLFASLMNTRLEYYREFQAISDQVGLPLADDPDARDWRKHDRIQAREKVLKNSIQSESASRRYMLHLQDEEKDPEGQEARRKCVICQDQIKVGSLTVCGHQFCKECMLTWWNPMKSCPTCKRKLVLSDLHDVTYKPKVLTVVQESVEAEQKVGSGGGESVKHSAIYTDISDTTLAAIQNIELSGPSYTSKVDTIARHILYLRESDPGSKSIIFTQFKDFLDVLSHAFEAFRIGFTSMSQKGGIEKFKNDPSIDVFLLHGKAQSSGINLVNASHVFLCEPLINTALELQAIARVDRIGQFQKTNVYLYLVQDTVEEAIYQISVRRRMDYLGRKTKRGDDDRLQSADLEDNIEVANSLQLQQATLNPILAKGTEGGEIVPKEDLWNCLFGNIKDRECAVGSEVAGPLRRELTAFAAQQRRVSAAADDADDDGNHDGVE